METAEEIATAGMEAAAGEVETLCRRLLVLHDGLPVTPQEIGLEDLGQDTPAATMKRSAIKNVVANFLRPAAEDLRAAAAYQRPRSWRTWDLTVFSEETQRRLYDLVAEQSFPPRRSADPEETRVPPATPEQGELRVWFQYGRWWAAFRKLDVPAGASEEEQWEVLRLDENEQKPGSLLSVEI